MIHAIGVYINYVCNYLLSMIKNGIKEGIWYDLAVKNVSDHSQNGQFNLVMNTL